VAAEFFVDTSAWFPLAVRADRAHVPGALAFIRHVTQPPNLVVHATPEREARAIGDWLERYDDQDFSFADAVSFTVMAERGITDALTLDGHFASAGFRVLP
jgi:uncharacterized protein